MGYKKLDIWQRSRELVIDIHKMSLNLPKFELYETGSQIRRSMKAVKANIVEGYGRRHYKNDFIRFIIYALASTDETIDHLETLHETGSRKDDTQFQQLHERLNILSKMINNFLSSVQKNHKSTR
ncbi:four helix bundle protein [Fodinibius salsisoli]|uniref:Four helix bundle protein n=1 Tax=Fodinibius salsisoli TaxID=2820877 RepID=A0ABT3PSB3_9BACT|nr:four helix bundle protein [Fodinibius salsisoli]MCW9708759.1 four helix bundle protein [Fodinibius salsisoli]